MNSTAALSAIRSRFKTLVADAESVKVAYDNAPFAEPSNEVWVRLTLLPGGGIQQTLGASKQYRTPGLLSAQIFQPIGQGDKLARALAVKIKKNFRAVTAGGVTYRTPSETVIGRDGQWWQINVDCPFYFTELDTD